MINFYFIARLAILAANWAEADDIEMETGQDCSDNK